MLIWIKKYIGTEKAYKNKKMGHFFKCPLIISICILIVFCIFIKRDIIVKK